MTRWARSGSSQKHKKPPEDPTKWADFFKPKSSKIDLSNRNSDVPQCTENEHLPDKVIEPLNSSHVTKKNHKAKKQKKMKYKLPENVTGLNVGDVHLMNETVELTNFASVDKKAAKNCAVVDHSDITESNQTCKIERQQVKGEKKKKPKSVHIESVSEDDSKSESMLSQERLSTVESLKTAPDRTKKKKESFFDKVKRRRAENGILLLPPKTEQMLYNMKRKLRNKGVPNEKIKEITRQVRRREELKFRKTLKTCYKCRKTGHIMADCPLINTGNEEGTGICFKCGSTEHTSYKCSIKTPDFPFAKCFVCQEQGHLSRSCPKNKHGAYPKGGSCNLCGSINHLKRDCPSLKRKEEETEVTIGRINNMSSVDDIDESENYQFTVKKVKTVKF